jgi:acyl-CoA synthetase (NDP forming)
MGSRGASIQLGSRETGYVPSYTFPEATATALAAACEYGEWLKRPKGVIPELKGIDKRKVEHLHYHKGDDHPYHYADHAPIRLMIGR